MPTVFSAMPMEVRSHVVDVFGITPATKVLLLAGSIAPAAHGVVPSVPVCPRFRGMLPAALNVVLDAAPAPV